MPSTTPIAEAVIGLGIGASVVQQLVLHTTLNAALFVMLNPGATATSVYPLPGRSMVRSRKVAIP